MPRPLALVRSADKLLTSSAHRALGGPAGSYQMPVRKVVLEVNQSKASHEGMREFLLHRLGLVDLARRYPFVEFVVQDRPTPHPVIRGFYTNGNTKVLSVKDKTFWEVSSKIDMVMQASGARVRKIKEPVVSHAPSARGIFSSLHSDDRTRFYDGLPKPHTLRSGRKE